MSFLVPIGRDVNFHCGFLTVPKVLEKVKRGKTEAVETPILHMHIITNNTWSCSTIGENQLLAR